MRTPIWDSYCVLVILMVFGTSTLHFCRFSSAFRRRFFALQVSASFGPNSAKIAKNRQDPQRSAKNPLINDSINMHFTTSPDTLPNKSQIAKLQMRGRRCARRMASSINGINIISFRAPKPLKLPEDLICRPLVGQGV